MAALRGPIRFLKMNDEKRNSSHSLWNTLKTVRGNQRACLLTEPLWGIPNTLYAPFAAVYMSELGLSAIQIGIVAALSMAVQMFSSLLGGVLSDKWGRRRCTFIIDLICWSVPMLLLALAKDYRWFYASAVFNGLWRISEVSFGLLLVEEADKEKLVHIYSITNIAGLLAGFLAPLSYLLVRYMGLVPAMRVLYSFAFVSMTVKFFILYFASHDTEIAKRRKQESKQQSVATYLWDGRKVLKTMLTNRSIMLVVSLIACYLIIRTVNDNFWPLLLTKRLGIAEENLSLFSTLRVIVMLVCSIFLVPRINVRRFRFPLMISFGIYGLLGLLYAGLQKGYVGLVLMASAAEAFSLAILFPLTNALQATVFGDEERARMMGFCSMMILFVNTPMSAFAGWLSKMNHTFPMLLNIAVALIAVYLTQRLHEHMETDGKVL